jgi:hypothetical protein
MFYQANVTKSVESNVSIFTRMFDSKTDHAMPLQPSGLLEDDGG